MRLSRPTIAWLLAHSWSAFSMTSVPGATITAATSQGVHPILVRNEYNELLQLVLDVKDGNDVKLRSIQFSLEGTDDIGDLALLELFSGDPSKGLSASSPFGAANFAARAVSFRGDKSLDRGPNVFWLSCRLKAEADLSHRVGAFCTAIETTAGEVKPRDFTPGRIHRIGV